MVMFGAWQQTALDPGIRSDSPMNGKSSDSGPSAPDPAGYLGKVNERASLVENCPWCSARGQAYGLRSYRINFHESITLCANPECLFPLVSKPLEEILHGLTPGDGENGGKRRSPSGEDAVACSKRHKAEGPDGGELASPSNGVPATAQEVRPAAEEVVPPPEGRVLIGASEGQETWPTAEPEVSLPEGQAARFTEDADEFPMEELDPTAQEGAGPTAQEEAGPTAQEGAGPTAQEEAGLAAQEEAGPAAQGEAGPMEQEEAGPTAQGEAGPTAQEGAGPTAQEEAAPTAQEGARPTAKGGGGPVGMVAAPSHLFWRNENNLCWLDALLVALVHCRTLRKRAASLLKNRSPIQRLCNRYSQACDLVKASQQTCPEDKVVRVPSAVLNQALKELEDLRISAFQSLQPKLKCHLGEQETPVFALPVLLRLDSEAEALFQHIFHWDFECAACGHTSRSRGQKTLSTFTGVLPAWHPLCAVHQARCSQCMRREQRRKMVLKSISPVFALHFVEGLPQNDVDAYSFDFHGNHFFVSTVIQYDQHLKHFATWIRDDSGSWLEFDDLKYPQCTSHKSLPIPADQIHMAFWEARAGKSEGGWCPGARRHDDSPRAETGAGALDGPQDDTYIVEALTEGGKASPDGLDASVGSATLLEAFEGLSHSDIVTLTLVEVKVDADGRALDGEEGGPPVAVETSPVSSSGPDDGKGRGTPRRPRGRKAIGTVAPLEAPPPVLDLPPPTPDLPPPVLDLPPPVIKAPSPSAFPYSAGWSSLLSRHPCHQPAPVVPKRVSPTPSYKPALKLATEDDGPPGRAAEMFRGFQARAVAAATDGDPSTGNEGFKQPWQKPACPLPPSLKPTRRAEALPQNVHLGPVKRPEAQDSTALSDTGALRLRLLKRLKRKKKLLAALDCVMGKEAPDSLQWPDSTEICSPYAVSSTTSQGSVGSSYDDFLSDLVSPATSASNLSPDSTGLLEMLVTGQDAAEVARGNPALKPPGGGGTDWHAPMPAESQLASAKDDFLDELMSGSAGLQPGHTAENVDFNVFDMFF